MCHLYTSRIGCVREGAVDITIKSNPDHVLSPTWELVGGHKRGEAESHHQPVPAWAAKYAPLTDQGYTERYLEILRNRWHTRSEEFIALLNQRHLGLLCYCGEQPWVFCHRHVAARQVLLPMGTKLGIEVVFNGELAITSRVENDFPLCPWCLDNYGSADAPCIRCLQLGAIPGKPPEYA